MNRTFNHELLASIGGEVRAELGGVYYIEGTPQEFMADTRNIVLADDYGFAAFHWAGPRIYAAHYAFVVGHRGKEAFGKCKAALHTMFTTYNAYSIWACAPLQLRASTLMIRWLGFKRVSAYDGCEYYVIKDSTP